MMIFVALAIASFRFCFDENAMLIALARQSVEAEVAGKPPPKPTSRSDVKPVFVTIERNGKVIGCRGDLSARSSSLEQEVILTARGAAAHDPRYKPLKATDLEGFLVTLTIVSGTTPISNVDSLNPEDGLVLKSGDKTGIVLPWEGRDPQVRLKWAHQKAGVRPGASISLFRLIATRSRG